MFEAIASELTCLVDEWEKILSALDEETISVPQNKQRRNIREIVGHLADSASNNTHRAVHLQYREIPLRFPNYATYGNNDKWLRIQAYRNENWQLLLGYWKYAVLHFAHVIQHIDPDSLQNEWFADINDKITLKKMVESFPEHFRLHLKEIEELSGNRDKEL